MPVLMLLLMPVLMLVLMLLLQVQRLPVCAECGKQKCMAQGDCCVKHVGNDGEAADLIRHSGELAVIRQLCDWDGNGGSHLRLL